MRKNNPDNSKRQKWLNFLRNHTKYIVGIDLLVERTIYLKTIYVFIAIYHLKSDSPIHRPIQSYGQIVSSYILGGSHYKYRRAM